MPFLYKISVGIIRGLKGLLAGVVIGITVDRAIKFIDGHQIYDLADSQIGAAVRWLDWVISQSWFWPSFLTLAGFVSGTYLDAFVRRYRGAQPVVKIWFDPLDAIERYATDGEVRNAKNNARERQERLKLEYDSIKRRLDTLVGTPPFGSSGGIMDPGPSSPAIDAVREQLAQTRIALTASGEPILRAEREILEELISQLKRGVLTAKGFRVQGDQIADEQTIIPTSHWLLVHFDTHDEKRQSVGGGGKNYKGLQIGLNENRR